MSSRVPTSLLLLLFLLLLLLQGDSHGPLRRSRRRWILSTLELAEEDPGPFPKFVGQLFNNMSHNMPLTYLINGPGVDREPEIGLFSIEDHENGKIYVHRPVDRETTPSFTVYFDAVNRLTGKTVDNSLIFNIRIRDVNDHAPQFPKKEFNVSVREDHGAGPIFQMLTVDLDQENTPNSQVLYSLVSQTPSLDESVFEIDRDSGEIRLSGCLDYESAPQFTLLIRARDCGEPPLSSTATVHVSVREGNNHRPTFAQEHYEIEVPEGQVSPGVLRLLVQDRDSPFTSAWRARFNISTGNEGGHFDIRTDPETNAGIVDVIKALDYEAHPAARSLVVAVENEEPLFSCEGGEVRRPRAAAASATVSVRVTDHNDPPAFHPRTFIVSEVEGAGPGTQLGVFNATDPDGTDGRIRYKLLHDPAHWVSVDEHSGVVVTRGQLDRESPYVNDSFYRITAQAVDDGHPPQTGTGTLLLFLSDVNDNAPTLHPRSQYLEVCESSVSEPLLIEAEDRDLEPYADPFTFELDAADAGGSAGDMWRLGERQGRSVELWMRTSLPCGNHSVPLLIADRQGLSRRQAALVGVCSCPGGATGTAESTAARPELLVGVLAPLCAGFVALAVALLLLLRFRVLPEAKRPPRGPLAPDGGQQTLIAYNDESRGAERGAPCRDSDVDGATFPLSGSPPRPSRPRSLDLNGRLPPAPCAPEHARLVLGAPVYLGTAVPRRPLDVSAAVMAEVLRQKLLRLAALAAAEDAACLPRVYAVEGECDRGETLSSPSCSERTPPLDVRAWLGPEA
ncbi:cadherin-like protein 26 isoform X1 [Saccopteryx bilineata]|uniref:cadherin-like protein 26 isoform X1 n=1 Tax=Saccopteryx bilineata TaxID=59482 RepID=UPI00338FAFA7